MLLTSETPDCNQYLVYDCEGHLIPCVVSFDTKSEEIELSISVMKNGEEKNQVVQMFQKITDEDGVTRSAPIFVKFKLPGAYAMKNNERIED